MARLLNQFLLLLAVATDKALARHVQFIEAGNQVPRGKLSTRSAVTPAQRRRLLKFGLPLGIEPVFWQDEKAGPPAVLPLVRPV